MKIDYGKLEDYCLKRGFEKPLILEKDLEKYIFLYDDNSSKELFQQLGKYAANQGLSFTWRDAAILSQKVMRLKGEREGRILKLEEKVC